MLSFVLDMAFVSVSFIVLAVAGIWAVDKVRSYLSSAERKPALADESVTVYVAYIAHTAYQASAWIRSVESMSARNDAVIQVVDAHPVGYSSRSHKPKVQTFGIVSQQAYSRSSVEANLCV